MTSGGTGHNPTSPGTSIPVWVSGQQVWVRGVDKKTTVGEIIVAFVGKGDEARYSVVERWKTGHKPLEHGTRILKLWNAWAANAHLSEVKLSLEKKSNVDDDSGRGSPSSTTTNTTATTATSCRRRHRNKNKHRQASQTLHPKRLEQISKTHNVEKESIENLLKLILVQGETIQSQLQKLQDRNKKIEMLEQLQHKNRINMLGTNYVIDTYLNDLPDNVGEASNQTSRTQRNQSSNQIVDDVDDEEDTTLEEEVEREIQELQKKIELFENISKLNEKIEGEEEKIIKLNHAIKSHENNEQINYVINKIEKLSINNKTNMKLLETHEIALSETDGALLNRKKYLSCLENQFQSECILESEYIHGLEVLNDNLVANTYSSLTTFNKNHRNDDSNSGAMSLQPMGVLDTLV
uniref:Ras association domain-containing protein 10 n=1 Tax=Cacopsylla melanoneura TaxID=428564 RepID=A0A8D9AI09_9HEMI